MAEDYTYTAEPTRAQLAARVQELERALAQADSNMVALAVRNAELRARLDAVPVTAMRKLLWGDPADPGHIYAISAVGDWLIEQADKVQP